MSRSYHFTTNWTIDAPIDVVWKEIFDADKWPSWWRGVVSVRLLEPGDENGVGTYRRFVWRSRLPYTLTFNMRTIRVEPPRVIEGVADGELAGIGRWLLTSRHAATDLRYDWHVDASKWWMQLLAPVARPLFEWNHDVVMDWGRQGLSKRVARR